MQKYNNYFGGNREAAIQRDSQRCVLCGMTRELHKTRFNRDITVDHIDGMGRNSNMKNNSLNNLQTLCLICHGRKDIARRKSFNGAELASYETIEKMRADRKLGMTYKQIGIEYHVSLHTAWQRINRKT